MYPTQAYSIKHWFQHTAQQAMFTASHHVALDTPALERFGPWFLLYGKLYLSNDYNISLQPIVLALLLYIQ